jgi:hypothetical protein
VTAQATWSGCGVHTGAGAGVGAQPTTGTGTRTPRTPWAPWAKATTGLEAVLHGAREYPMHTGAEERHRWKGQGRVS